MDHGAEYYGSQVPNRDVINYTYTDMPWKLILLDMWYAIKYSPSLPHVLWPLFPTYTFDELRLNVQNMWCMFIHAVLIILQVSFFLSLPMAAFLPGWTTLTAIGVFLSVNWVICRFLLNGPSLIYKSRPQYALDRKEHQNEQWIFLNGVSVGRHWLQGNLDRLALTFGRPIIGVHNRTNGIIFDLIEVMVQRCLNLGTSDIRLVYKVLKGKLYDDRYDTVIFILHSQGGVEGGLVIDWLLQELPQDLLHKLEVYTFGNAANHFNNPHRHAKSQALQCDEELTTYAEDESPSYGAGFVEDPEMGAYPNPTAGKASTPKEPNGKPDLNKKQASLDRAIRHIEHYAHTSDFVAKWGILHFATNERATEQIPRFVGRLFSRDQPGHMLNQHYLHGMFPLARNSAGDYTGCAEDNEFMESFVGNSTGRDHGANHDFAREGLDSSVCGVKEGAKVLQQVNAVDHGNEHVQVKDLSRLWQYRNGRIPKRIDPKSLA
ncbi:hypothetical protein PG995_004543 [Apiospora arundinis]